MSFFRTIDIDGALWQFKVGETYVHIRAPEGKKGSFLPKKSEINAETVRALSQDEIEASPQLVDKVTPGEIAAYIRANCLDKITS